MLYKYSAEKHTFTSHRIQDFASDAYIIMNDLNAEFSFAKSEVQGRFPASTCDQLLERTNTFLYSE